MKVEVGDPVIYFPKNHKIQDVYEQFLTIKFTDIVDHRIPEGYDFRLLNYGYTLKFEILNSKILTELLTKK